MLEIPGKDQNGGIDLFENRRRFVGDTSIGIDLFENRSRFAGDTSIGMDLFGDWKQLVIPQYKMINDPPW